MLANGPETANNLGAHLLSPTSQCRAQTQALPLSAPTLCSAERPRARPRATRDSPRGPIARCNYSHQPILNWLTLPRPFLPMETARALVQFPPHSLCLLETPELHPRGLSRQGGARPLLLRPENVTNYLLDGCGLLICWLCHT